MPAFVQIMSILYTIVVAVAFLFHTVTGSYLPRTTIVPEQVISYVEETEPDLAFEEQEYVVQRADWFDADSYEYPGTLLASSYGHDTTLTIEERNEIQPLFEHFDREVSKLIANWTQIPEDWF